MIQFQKGESTGFYQMQGLIIMAYGMQPKITVGAIVILEVFDHRLA
jgi:hypothetical protein